MKFVPLEMLPAYKEADDICRCDIWYQCLRTTGEDAGGLPIRVQGFTTQESCEEMSKDVMRAYNSHEVVVNALRRIVAAMRPEQYPIKGSDGDIVVERPEYLSEAMDALAKAEAV